MIHDLMRDGAVVLEKVVVACLGGGGYFFHHRLLRKSVLASLKGVRLILAGHY